MDMAKMHAVPEIIFFKELSSITKDAYLIL